MLSLDRLTKLGDIGFDWVPHETAWEKGFKYLKGYKEREGSCDVPSDYKENGFPLGRWVNKQRAKKDQLSVERRAKLDELGFAWDLLEAAWEEAVRHLTCYREREGHCRVPSRHIEDGFPLGEWVIRQRSRKMRMPVNRQRRLDELGFIWDAREAAWEEGFNLLKTYKEREGHCRVPSTHKENGFPLGTWVANQRTLRSTTPIERQRRLDELGFVWNLGRRIGKKASSI